MKRTEDFFIAENKVKLAEELFIQGLMNIAVITYEALM